jgi:hypothetical protein
MALDDFFNQANTSVPDTTPEELKRELQLDFDNFNKPAYYSGLQALAQMVHNLCFIVPGTYPSAPEMGINIRQYQFELLYDQELRNIQHNIQDQIDTYIPNSNISEIICQLFTDPVTQQKNLGIGFAMASNPLSPQTFFVFFKKNTKGDVVSNIIYS